MHYLSDHEHAAIHESAHCVAALTYGLDVAGMVLSPNQTGRGDEMAGGTAVTSDSTAFVGAVVSLAGLVANQMCGMDRNVAAQRAGDDLHCAEQLLAHLSEDDKRKVGVDVRNLLTTRWGAVMALAAALAAQGELVREDIARIVGAVESSTTGPGDPVEHRILARTDLPRSVYSSAVEADSPAFWWRLDENRERLEEGSALNSGSVGTAGDGTFYGAVDVGGRAMIVGDPGTSVELVAATVAPGIPASGVEFPSSELNLLERLNDGKSFAIEFWARPAEESLASYVFFQRATSPGTSDIYVIWFTDPGNTGLFRFTVNGGDAGSGTFAVETGDNTAPPGGIYHVVFKSVGGVHSIWLDGVEMDSGTYNAGTVDEATVNQSSFGGMDDANNNWTGRLSNVAVYLADSGDPLPGDRIAAHNEAGRTPWQDDQPADRADRILDVVGWPADRRELDDGDVALQSAAITGQTALEHMHKVGETERGLFFVNRAGTARLIDRATIASRVSQATFGDGPGEIGYRDIKFDDGDTVIRNRATISRLNGVAKTDQDDASVDEFGRFDYTLEGLLHRTDAYSQDYAEFVVDEYAEPRRRVVGLTLGPVHADDAAVLYPQMLGREIGDAITIHHRPPGGGGDGTEQVCVIEGIEHSATPGGYMVTKWVLSPEFGESGVPSVWGSYGDYESDY